MCQIDFDKASKEKVKRPPTIKLSIVFFSIRKLLQVPELHVAVRHAACPDTCAYYLTEYNVTD